MTLTFPPYHRYLQFMSPLSDQRAHELACFLAARATGTVVDFGCGWARFLTLVLEANAEIRGIGIDLQDAHFEYARQIAHSRSVADRLTLTAGDARQHTLTDLGGAICIGASQIWGAPVEARQPLDYRAALKALRSAVRHSAPVIYGEGIWSAPPTVAATSALGGRADEFVILPELLDMATECGFAIVQVHEATTDEWDHFESGFTARYADWLAEHALTHPDSPDVLLRAQRQRDAYYRGYRNTLGMAYLALVAI